MAIGSGLSSMLTGSGQYTPTPAIPPGAQPSFTPGVTMPAPRGAAAAGAPAPPTPYSNNPNATLQQRIAPPTGQAVANPFTYGGSTAGPQQWTNYYQGLGATAAQQANAQRQQAMAMAGNTMAPWATMGQQGQAQYSGAAQGSQTMGSTAQQMLGAAGAGADTAAQNLYSMSQGGGAAGQALQQEASGAGLSGANQAIGQGAAAGIRAQLAAAASTRGGVAAQAAAGQQAATQAAQIQGNATAQGAQLAAQAQQQGIAGLANYQQNAAQQYAQYLQGAQTGLAGAANNQLGTLGNLGLGYAGLGEGASTTALQTGTQAGESYAGLGAQEQQNYEQMGQTVQQNQLQAALQAEGEQLGYQGTMAQIGAQQLGSLVGGTGAAVGAGLMLASDENLKTDASGPGATATATNVASVPGAGGLTKDQITRALQFFRTGMGQAYATQLTSPAASMPSVGLPGQPLQYSSDEGRKADVERGTADAYLRTLAGSQSTFRYKSPSDQPLTPDHPRDPNARFGGVMAQDLERVPEIGPQLVTDTSRGKVVEPMSAMSALHMGLGRLAERVAHLEGSRS